MATGAGGLRGSGTRGRRAHGPAPAPARALRTPLGRSAATARAPAAIFPASRPARPHRAPARAGPALWAWPPREAPPLVQRARARCPGWGPRPAPPAPGLGTAPQGPDSDGGSSGSAAGAARVGAPRGLGAVPGTLPSPALSVWRKAGGPGPAHRPPKWGTEAGTFSRALPAWRCGAYPGSAPGGSRPGEYSGPTWKPHRAIQHMSFIKSVAACAAAVIGRRLHPGPPQDP